MLRIPDMLTWCQPPLPSVRLSASFLFSSSGRYRVCHLLSLWHNEARSWCGSASFLCCANVSVCSLFQEYICPRCDSGFIEEVTEDSRWDLLLGFFFFFKILRPGGCSLSHSRCTLLSAAAKLLSAAAELLSAAAELLWIGAAAPLNFNVCFRVQWVLVVIIVFLFFFLSFCPFVLISPPQPPRGRRQWDRWHSRTLRRGTSCSEEMDSVLTESSLKGKDDSVQPADVFWLGLLVD